MSKSAERSSLVLGRNISTRSETGDSGRYDCRRVYSNYHIDDDETGEEFPYRCGSWDCYCCGYRMRMNLVEEIGRVCSARPAMRRLMTLTLDPSTAPADPREQHRYLTERWNALRTALDRRFGGSLSYIWVREEGEKSDDLHPHLHIIVNQYIPQGWLSSTWNDLGGGEVVDIRYVDRVEKTAHYLGKYLTKNALSGLPEGIRRYGSSQDISLDVRGDSGESEASYSLLMDDHEMTDENGDPVTRGVAGIDFVLQRRNGGPLGLDPPD